MENTIERILNIARQKRSIRRVIALLSAFTLLLTTNQLTFSASTLERIPMCNLEEHVHDALCFDESGNAVCGLEEHLHTDACYQQAPTTYSAMLGEDDVTARSEDVEIDAEESEIEASAIEGSVAEEAASLEPETEDVPTAEPEDSEAVSVDVEPVYDFNGSASARLEDIVAMLDVAVEDVLEVGESIDDDEQPMSVQVELSDDGASVTVLRDFIDDDMVELAIVAKDGNVYLVNLKNGVVPALPAEDAEELTLPEEEEVDLVPALPEDDEAEVAADGADEIVAPAEEDEALGTDVSVLPVEDENEPVTDVEAPAEEIEEATAAEQVKPVEETTEEPVEESAEEPAEEPVEETAEEPAEETAEEPVEEPAEEAPVEEEPAEEEKQDAPVNDESEEAADAEETEPVEAAEDAQVEEVTAEVAQDAEEGAALTGDEDISDAQISDDEAQYPAQAFEAHTLSTRVLVTADEGAFPAGTTMNVRPVLTKDTLAEIAGAVESDNCTVNRVHAVDITFYDAEGNEIEPLIPISVVMTVDELSSDDAVVVHMDDAGNTQLLETSESGEDGLVFDAESFSVYALVIVDRYISADGQTWNIQVTYNSEAGIPEGAYLAVTEAEASDYIDAAAGAVDGQITYSRFFDISIMADGKEVQPAVPVTVSVALDEFAEGSVQALHFDGDTVERVDAREDDGVVVFDAASFSVYGIVYTVDFHYNGVDYSIIGESQILLSQLIDILNITDAQGDKIAVGDVARVEFTDERLVTVRQVSGLITYNDAADVDVGEKDFLLTSNEPFTSDETLAITLESGEVITVGVTDDQDGEGSGDSGSGTQPDDLSSYLTNATIKAPTNSDGKYVVTPDTEYDISLTFAETSDHQFPDGGTMTYRLPAGLDGVNGTGSMTIKVNINGNTYPVPNNAYTLDNGVLTLTFNEGDDNWPLVTASDNLRFTLNFKAGVEENREHIEFGSGVTKDVVVDTSNSVTVSKVGNVDQGNNKIYYTVAIESQGKSTNVVLSDTLTGKGLTLDRTSFQAGSNKDTAVNGIVGGTGNSFTYTIPEMKDGERITLNYTADIDPSVLEIVDGKVVTTAGNSVRVESDGDKDNEPVTTTNEIDYTPNMWKSGGDVIDQDADSATQSWKITVNPNPVVSASGTKVTDRIRESSQSILKYSGDGITVLVKDASGATVRTDNVSWETLGVNTATATSWNYTIPDSDKGKAYTYEISYTTDADTTGMTKPTTINNDVTTDGGKNGSAGGQIVPLNYVNPELKKTHTNVDVANREVTWQISFVVPATGLTKAVVKDTYPNLWVTSGHAIEGIKEGSEVTVTGLVEGETWDLDTTTSAEYALITFTNGGNPGMKGTGKPRTITVTLKTEINEEWLRETKADTWKKDHTNAVELDYGTDKATDGDQIAAFPSDIKKTATALGTRTVNGVELPIYKYELLLTGVTSTDLTIEDAFDTDILTPYTDRSEWGDWKMVGGGIYNQYDEGVNRVGYVSTDAGMTIKTSAASMPMNTDGSFYEAYKLTYYLTVKDANALYKLMGKAAADNGKYDIHNTATWGTETGTGDITYEYKAVNKEILTSDADLVKSDEDIWAEYKITINPAAATLHGGEPMELVDTFENLSIDYTSIRATPSTGVSWDFDGNKATFTVPDETTVVITYRARVTFADLGSVGETKSQVIKNTATLEGYKDDVSKSVSRTNNGEGAADVYSINLLKYQAGDMSHTLAGAQFQLLDKNKKPVKDKDGNAIIYTTGDNGLIHVEGDQKNKGWALQADTKYYLKEIKAPAGYKLMDYDPEFIISSDGTTDYNHFIYHTNDTMSAKNYPGTQVPVEKVWEDGNAAHEGENIDVKLLVSVKGENSWVNVKDKDNNDVTLTLNKDNDWSGIFLDLPLTRDKAGSTTGEVEELEYKVEEVEVTGYTTEITGNGTDGYVITNTPNKGSLKVVKNIEGATPTQDMTFKFQITRVIGGTTYYYNEDGEASPDKTTVSVTVSAGQTEGSKLLENKLNPGKYTVTEVDDDGYAIADHSVTIGKAKEATVIAGQTAEAAVTNTYTAHAELKLKGMKFLDNAAATTTGAFSFTIADAGNAGDKLVLPENATVSNDGSGNFTFEGIKFTEAGTYTLKLSEQKGADNTIEYDPQTYQLTVVVGKVGNALVVTSVKYGTKSYTMDGGYYQLYDNDGATFKNTTKTGKLTIKKDVQGDVPSDVDQTAFKFTLTKDGKYYDASGAHDAATEITVSANSASGVTITNLPLGEYTLTETTTLESTDHTMTTTLSGVDGGTVSDQTGKVTFTVDGTEKLEFVVTAVNTYTKVGETSMTLKGVKTVDGGSGDVPANKFKFRVTDATSYAAGTPTYQKATVPTTYASNAAGGDFSISGIIFPAAGTYTLKVSEVAGTDTQYIYDAAEYTLTVDVQLDAATSTLSIASVKSKADDAAQIDLVKSGDAYVLKKTESGTAAFDNTLKTGELTIKKIETMDDSAAEENFTFTLTDSKGSTYNAFGEVESGATITVKAGSDGVTISGLPLDTYTIVESEAGKSGYTLSTTTQVVNGAATNRVTFAPAANETVDSETIVFTNTYTSYKDAIVTIPGTKTLEGKTLKGNDFRFRIVPKTKSDKNTAQTVSNNAAGTFTFPTLRYTAEDLEYTSETKEFVYEIYEVGTDDQPIKDGEGITADHRVFTVTVEVKPDAANGKYTASIKDVKVRENAEAAESTEVTKIAFVNQYDTKPVRVPLSAEKKLEGAKLKVGQFEFKLTPQDNSDTNKTQTKYNDENGKIDFDSLYFTKPGTYVYNATESSQSGDGMTTDASTYVVTIVVTDNGKGQLEYTKEVKLNGESVNTIVFKNKYEVGSTTAKVEATKAIDKGSDTLVSRAIKDGEFSFTLKPAGATGPNPDRKTADDPETIDITDPNAEQLVSNVGKNITFEEMTYNQAGTYIYDMEEASADTDSITVDSAKFRAIVTVTDDGKGNLNAAVTYQKWNATSEAYEDADKAEVEFVNTYVYGKLGLKKEVTGNKAGTDANTEFTFTILLKDSAGQPITDSYKYEFVAGGTGSKTLKFTDGKATVKLKKDQEILIHGLPNGARYEVTETAKEGYVTTWQGDPTSGTISSTAATPVVVCVNEHNAYGNMSITKKLEGNAKESAKKFPITIKVWTDATKGTPIDDGTYGNVAFENGVATVQLGQNELAFIEKLPYGAYYEVTEEDPDGYVRSIEATSKKGTLLKNDSGKEPEKAGDYKADGTKAYGIITDDFTGDNLLVVTITNTKDRFGGFSLGKVVRPSDGNDPSGEELTKKFKFTVTLSDTSYNGVYGDLSFTNGVATVELAHNETVSVFPLPHGVGYTIVEDDYTEDGYTNAARTITGSVVGTEPAADEVTREKVAASQNVETATNTHNLRGSLSVTKVLEGNVKDKYKTETFIIQMKLIGDEWKSAGEDVGDGKIKFLITSTASSGSAVPEYVTFETDGTGTFTLKPGETKSINNIPNGTQYQVSEQFTNADQDGFTYQVLYNGVVENDNTGTLNVRSENNVTVTNTKNEYGGLKLTKVTAGSDPDKKTWFAMQVELSDKTITGQYGDVHFVNGVSTAPVDSTDVDYTNGKIPEGYFKVKPAEGPLYVLGLPAGVSYIVHEDSYSATYDTQVPTNNTGEIKPLANTAAEVTKALVDGTEAADNQVTWTNTRDRTGKLRIEKAVEGTPLDPNQTFEFTITMKLKDGSPLTGTYDGVTFGDDGVATVNLKAGQSQIITGLPLNATFSVVETNPGDGYLPPEYSLSYNDTLRDENGDALKDADGTNLPKITRTFEWTGTTWADDELGHPVPSIQVDQRKVIVTNRPTSVTISKADFANPSTLLAGAKFELYEVIPAKDESPETQELVRTWKTSTVGEQIDGLKIDTTYILREVYAPKGYKIAPDTTFTIDSANKVTLFELGNAVVTADDAILVKDEKATEPTLEKKIKDINDSTGVESDWQDSADYDIDDDVPYQLTATLPDNVTDYLKYHITFHDEMDEGLTFKEITSVKVNGTATQDYVLTPIDNGFDLKLTWGDGTTRITDTTLNKAKVVVEFTATLNEHAVPGKDGNVNKAKLIYSNNPQLTDNGDFIDETDETDWDGVIAFTYQTVINKKNEKGEDLSGAEFKLEKKLADDSRVLVETITSGDGKTFTFKGLDDGTYILTETTAPDGYTPIEPIEFTVSAEHGTEWSLGEESPLTSLTGAVTTGVLTLTADDEKSKLTGDVTNDLTYIEITKVWHDVSGSAVQWDEGHKTVDFTLRRDSVEDGTQELATVSVTIDPEAEAEADRAVITLALEEDFKTILKDAEGTLTLPEGNNYADGYRIRIDKLPKGDNTVTWTYKLVENVPDDYIATYTNSAGEKKTGEENAKNGDKIINTPVSYELPSTGGPGTTLFTVSGLALIALALAMLMRRRRI